MVNTKLSNKKYNKSLNKIRYSKFNKKTLMEKLYIKKVKKIKIEKK